jgi:hypothetical protein
MAGSKFLKVKEIGIKNALQSHTEEIGILESLKEGFLHGVIHSVIITNASNFGDLPVASSVIQSHQSE